MFLLAHNKDTSYYLSVSARVAAGQRLKYEQYLNHWQENGYAITISSFMDVSMWNV